MLTTNLQASTFKFPRGCSRDQNGPSSAKPYDSRQHYLQQSGCIRRPDATGTSQRCSLQGGTTHPENQHIQVAVKLQHMLEADNEFRQTAGLPQLDLPEHLWTVRNMDTAPVREQHFMAISSEIEVLRQQLKGKGVYPAPPNYTQIHQQNVHFQPIQPAKLSPLQPQDRLLFDPLLSTTTGSTGSQSDSGDPKVHTPSRVYQNPPFRQHHM